MERVYVFADEAGNLDFRRVHGATAYFMIGTVFPIESAFHASEDIQAVRNEVFQTLQGQFRYDVTVFRSARRSRADMCLDGAQVTSDPDNGDTGHATRTYMVGWGSTSE